MGLAAASPLTMTWLRLLVWAALAWGCAWGKERVLLLHALDASGFKDAVNFARTANASAALTDLLLFVSTAHFASADRDAVAAAAALKELSVKHYSPNVVSLPDSSIGKKVKTEERVSFLLDGLNQTLALPTTSPGAVVVSLAFKKGTVPHPMPSFESLFSKAVAAAAAATAAASGDAAAAALPAPSGANLAADVVLLGKNRRLTSVSDWHDLGILVLRNKPAVRGWLQTLRSVYYHHADRRAFALLEPRPALLESLTQHRRALRVDYFSKGQVCRLHGAGPVPEGLLPASMDHCLQLSSFVSLECGDGAPSDGHHASNPSPCHTLDEPHLWRAKVERNIPTSFAARSPYLGPDKWKSLLHEAIWTGSLRFVHAHDAHTPRKFCWEVDRIHPPAAATGSTAGAGAEFAGEGSSGSVAWAKWRPGTPAENPALKNDAAGSAGEYSGCHPGETVAAGPGAGTGTGAGARAGPGVAKVPGGELLAQSRIYRAFDDSTLFAHDRDKWARLEQQGMASASASASASATGGDGAKQGAKPLSRPQILLMTGSHASASSIEAKLYQQISKAAYCKRHGYAFLHALSSQFTPFFPPDLYANIRAEMSHTAYFRGLMAKTLMVADALFTRLETEWVVWTDDDVYINTGWLYLPLEAFLADVPRDKVYVSANYRSMFTNVFAVRNSAQGRRLVLDWIAVAMSGHVQCHGFDQAAIGTLLLARVARSMNDPRPFNHTCLWSDAGFTGCNAKGDWSCDFKVEASLYRAGFKTRLADFFGQKISSVTKGCANAAVPDFHVVPESAELPRWQCGLCSRLYEVESCGHWDGPLGGGNDILRRGAVNGWFFNHKAEFLFWESYLDPANCDYVPDAVPLCPGSPPNASFPASFNGSASPPPGPGSSFGFGAAGPRGVGVGHTHHLHAQSPLLSLIDGYMLNLETGTYCRTVDPQILSAQSRLTYMKDYKGLIAAVKEGYSVKRWWEQYRMFSGGEGRDSCLPRDTKEPTKCDNGWGPDGQKNRKKRIGQEEDHIFERAAPASSLSKAGAGAGAAKGDAFCAACKTLKSRQDKYGIDAVDCRSEEDVKNEKDRNVNQE